MSHLTASPFHKPSAFEFPQRSTSTDTFHPPAAQLPTPASIIGGVDLHSAEYFETPSASISPEASGSRFRRLASSIGYHNSGLRESRERTVQRSSRTFVVVLPPPSLPQDHGHLGHTLSSGPRHRLAQGLLMPLFPTMYGQLTAIAREYNFPSTAGLCLYLHFTEHGITATPRISDDSWQMIWSHAFEGAHSAHLTLPISGKIEFDIDLRVARWYGAWMASSHREHVDVPMSVTPSAAPSVIHYRGDSRTSFVDGDDQDNQSVSARPPPRHVPRKLSLIDRFDTMSARSVSRSVANRGPPADNLPGSQNLSPIFQEDEPKTAKFALEHKVNSWRASAQVLPGVTEAGHVLLAGANLPNSPLDESPNPTSDDDAHEGEIALEDYSFSISSAGPGDYDPYSPLTWFYDPSVHLADRLQGSVCMTPSDCTSFGPSDYTLPSPVPSLYERTYTPDVAHRMFEDVPPSPSIATSWGAPLSYPPSSTSDYRAPSVDLGERQCFSRPQTPMTATSWGAPMSFPPSPTTPYHVHTPDAGQRAFDLSAFSDHDAPWPLVWPFHGTRSEQNTAQEPDAPWSLVWPFHVPSTAHSEQAATQDADAAWPLVWPFHDTSAHISEDTAAQGSDGPWPMVWPYHNSQRIAEQKSDAAWPLVWPFHNNHSEQTAAPGSAWPMVWPYHNSQRTGQEQDTASFHNTRSEQTAAQGSDGPWPMVWPYHNSERTGHKQDTASFHNTRSEQTAAQGSDGPWPMVWPYHNSQRIAEQKSDAAWPLVWPFHSTSEQTTAQGSPWPMVWPYHNSQRTGQEQDTASFHNTRSEQTATQGSDGPWPMVWPYHNSEQTAAQEPAAPWSMVWPFHTGPTPWRRVWPYHSDRATEQDSISISHPSVYPSLNIYPAVYPHFDLYPAASGSFLSTEAPENGRGPITIRLLASAQYPTFDLYPATTYPHNLDSIYYTAEAPENGRGPVTIRLLASAQYPTFDLYPATTYPHNLDSIYYTKTIEVTSPAISTRLSPRYLLFDLYPAVYPHVVPYPSFQLEMEGYPPSPPSSQYPHFNIYPAIAEPTEVSRKSSVDYPYFDLYPALSLGTRSPGGAMSERGPVPVVLRVAYPVFNLYPAVYPAFDIYPGAEGVYSATSAVSIRLTTFYPIFNLYPAVYPSFDLYPALPMERPDLSSSKVLSAGYPDFNIYPAVSRRRNAPRVQSVSAQESGPISVRLPASYPFFNLYPAVYPSFDLYPALPMEELSQVLSAGYPDFNIYPAVLRRRDAPKTRVKESGPITVRLPASYPFFDLYPAVYPSFDLYPALPMERPELSSSKVLSACYPDFNIYPAVLHRRQSGRTKESGPITVRLPVSYPLFDMYPAVYPVFELYPGLPEDCHPSLRKTTSVSIRIPASYPLFNLYPAVYPVFELYPALPEDCHPSQRKSTSVSVRLSASYPLFDLYPAVYPSLEIYPSLPEDCISSQVYYCYPHFNLYPPVGERSFTVQERHAEMICHPVKYPVFNLYPAVYPHFDLYPEAWKATTDSHSVPVGAVAEYPVFNLYPAVYPFFDLYPNIWQGPDARGISVRADARYPYFDLYPAIYPHHDLYPALLSIAAPRLPKQSRFTRSDLHAIIKKSPLSKPNARAPSKTHQALHLAVFPRGVDVLTPSGTEVISHTSQARHLPSKTHRDLHHIVFPSNVEVSTPSGTGLKDVVAPLPIQSSPRPQTRLRSGTVTRTSLPPSPRPVRPVNRDSNLAPAVSPVTPPTGDTPRRTLSTRRIAPSVDSTPTASPMTPPTAEVPRRILSTRRPAVEHVVPGHTISRSVSMVAPAAPLSSHGQLDRSVSVTGPRANPPRKRDSMVLQRVRALQMNSGESIREDDPMSSIPLPPRPNVPPARKPVVS